MPLDFSKLLFIDFEAQSEADIRKVGAYAYAAHPTTVPLCAAWAIGDAPVQLWKEGQPTPGEWPADVIEQDFTWVAHNHETEQELLRHKFGLVFNKWIDTASLASAAGLPRNLEDVANALHLETVKGDSAVMLQVARPRKPSKDNPAKFWRPETRPDLFERLYAYNIQDVEVMRAVLKALPPYHWVWTPREEKLHDVTRAMNQVGLKIDIAGVDKALITVREHENKLKAEFETLLPGINPKSPVIAAKALGLANVAKDTIRDALKASHPHYRALEILKTLNTAATAKVKAFKSRTNNERLHGAMVFHGAGTGRWSSMGVQLHNLLRGLAHETPDWPAIDKSENANELAFAALHSGTMAELYPNPIRAIASMMKGFILGPLLAGDFSQIEARTLAKLARQFDLLDAFANKKDPYRAMASRLYVKPPERISTSERFMGKQVVLGCGYGLGKHGFQYLLKTVYDIDVTLDESDRIVKIYRAANENTVSYWWALERLAKQAVMEQPQTFMTSSDCPGIGVRTFRRWLCIRIPSGRVLWYYEPELEPDEKGMTLFYQGRDTTKGGRWSRIKLYGGKLAGHVTQATARDIMADAMLRLLDAGFTLLLTVHDEIVSPASDPEVPEETARFAKLMRQPPAWWPDIPLDVEVHWSMRYQK
jgi:DNA polymerase